MKRDLSAFAACEFDVLIVGGGINGAGAARDAAMRGLRVALVDKGDFANGTSSRSSKLVHGGIRYLEQRDFKLVLESSLGRRILLRIAPDLVHPLPFIFPVYRGDRHGLRTIQLGMWLYDLLSLFRNQRHHMLSAKAAVELEPGLRSDGLRAAALYYDAQMDDARLCLANVTSAVQHGATVANYVRVVNFHKQAGRLCGAAVRDEQTGAEFEVRAKVIINATGPWLDDVCALDAPQPPKLRLTKGSHIVVPALTSRHAVTIQSSDRRVIFVIPWERWSLVGTTDTDYQGPPEKVRPAADEIGFLLSEVRRIIPGHQLTASDVVASFSGLRALVRSPVTSAGATSREERIYESPSGMLSLGGGKFTTYRLVAKRLIDRISSVPCRTHLEPLPGGWMGGNLKERTSWAVQEEMALTVDDVLRRRTQVTYGLQRGLPEAETVADVMGELLGWSQAERQAQVGSYAASLRLEGERA